MTYLERLQLKDEPPADEACHCTTQTSLHLRYAFSEFPFFCTGCIGQVFPSVFRIPEDLAAEIVSWRTVYAALYDLWLDSRGYEAFARTALLDPDGDVNRQGLALASKLSEQRTIYYWWFNDGESTPEHCPVCGILMDQHRKRRFRFCHACRISR
jgi:hypothetical protein